MTSAPIWRDKRRTDISVAISKEHIMISETTLTYQVYVAPIIAMAGKDVPPGQSRSTWSPISATLISGRHDAVLVDPLMTVEQGMAVADSPTDSGSTRAARKKQRRPPADSNPRAAEPTMPGAARA